MVASFREHSSRVSEVGNRLEMGSIKGSVKSHVGLRCTEGLGVSCIYVLSHSVVSDSVQPHGLYVAHQAPLFMVFSRQEYWSGLSFLSPGDCLDPGIEPSYPALQADSLPSEPPGKHQIDSGSASSPGSAQAVQFNPLWPPGPTGFPDTRMTLPECCPVLNQSLSAWSDPPLCPDTHGVLDSLPQPGCSGA